MNIKEAKEEIRNAIVAYFSKDDLGSYVIPIEKQRPIFLMGPPGIGKTAIMEQVAQELNVGLVSYSMTHHTRQSALGLPFISHKVYGGVEYEVSEYTMSEIIASVYDMMEFTGISEGILFLDEINCVSETLAPSMLQFLQYKVFGRHKVPDGWIVVTAGNPPEYNNSVREFDIVTWDRLKRIDVEPDYSVWKEYAVNKGIHPAVITYLDIKKDDFYSVESTVDGKAFVTARGWDDLSSMIKIYETKNLSVKQTLIEQYLQEKRIAKNFAVYYDLFQKYRSDYQVDRIIGGTADTSIIQRAADAEFDERLALLGLILDALFARINYDNIEEKVLERLVSFLREKKSLFSNKETAEECIKDYTANINDERTKGRKSGSASASELRVLALVDQELQCYINTIKKSGISSDLFSVLKEKYNEKLNAYRRSAQKTSQCIDNSFAFAEKAFGEGQEVLIIVTELTVHSGSAHFISRHGSEGYFKHNKELLFYERRKDILREIEKIEI